MKKISVLAVVGVMATVSAFAGSGNMANNSMNNTKNNMMQVMTVEQVRAASDNTPVIMQCYLLRQNCENSYVFQDSTGTINLEIENSDWNGMTVSPTDFIEVWGEVDKNGMSMIEVDVSAMKKL